MTEATPVQMVATLGIAGLISGVVLVGAYEVTAPIIEQNRVEALHAAIGRVLPGTVKRETWVLGADGVARPLREGAEAPESVVYAAYDADGHRLGFALPAAGAGFQDTIALLYGLVPERGRVVGMEVLSSLETPGLGDNIAKDPVFLGSFTDLAVAPAIVAAKRGQADLPNEVDGITGATISSKAVVRIVNESNARWLGPLEAAGPGGSP